MEAYFLHVQKDLYGGPQALVARDFLLRGVARKPEDKAVYALIVGAGISLLPALGPHEAADPDPLARRRRGRDPGRPAAVRRAAVGGPASALRRQRASPKPPSITMISPVM